MTGAALRNCCLYSVAIQLSKRSLASLLLKGFNRAAKRLWLRLYAAVTRIAGFPRHHDSTHVSLQGCA
jgi:hypothetical protein